MKHMNCLMASVGWLVTVLAIAGAIGIGHFRLYYGPEAPMCGAKP
ncbi:hypothetical protein P3T24_004346 [Paraburkholderia sp. GAS33]